MILNAKILIYNLILSVNLYIFLFIIPLLCVEGVLLNIFNKYSSYFRIRLQPIICANFNNIKNFIASILIRARALYFSTLI